MTVGGLSTIGTTGLGIGYIKFIQHRNAMRHLNTVRIIDLMGLHPETRGKARYVSVKTYEHACAIADEQNKLGNVAHVVNW